MTQERMEPRTSDEMVALLFEMGRFKIFAETLDAARQKRLTRADFIVVQRRVTAALDEARASADEFAFDVDEAVDRARRLLDEFCRRAMPRDWR